MPRFAEPPPAFRDHLRQAGVPDAELQSYQKWARYFLDFCQRHGHQPSDPASIAPFIDKLAAKGQPPSARAQAKQAVRLLLGLDEGTASPTSGAPSLGPQSWDDAMRALEDQIRRRADSQHPNCRVKPQSTNRSHSSK